MTAGTAARLDAAELERAVKAVEPAAFLVPPRILRRVIRTDRRLVGIGLDVPHSKSYVIGRDALRPIVEKQELGLRPDANLPSTAILLVQPEPEKLAAWSREEVLIRYWRLLFHAHVHLALERRLAERKLTAAAIRQRIHQIGQTEFNEVRTVLRQEHFLLPPRDDQAVYVEFAAVYLELRHFAPSLLPRYFPTIQSYEVIDAILAQDVDAARLFAGTRLPGAPLPAASAVPAVEQPEPAVGPPAVGVPSEAAYRRLMDRADQAAMVGNTVRAVIRRTRAAVVAPPEHAVAARAAARAELDRLTDRLQAALELDDLAAEQWRQALAVLPERAAQGIWPVEARLLYDLQKVCIDRERAIYAVDLVEWGRSWGRRPIKRLLPHQPDLLALKHLRSAARRLRGARLSEADRTQLAGLLTEAVHRAEHRLREQLRPLVAETLRQVGLAPQNVAEQVALHKLTEELLDQVAERGYLNMGQLRDAVSRNQLKLPDLAGPGEFLRGDRLLRANARLAEQLDGIYRRGEVYLRELQRLSSLAFGTPPGRFLTRYLALPFGGAAIISLGLYYLIEEISKGLQFLDASLPTIHVKLLMSPVTIGLLGVFLFLLLHVPRFRAAVGRGLKQVYRGARAVLVDLPAYLLELPLVQRVLRSRALRFSYHYLFKPLAFAVPVGLFLRTRETAVVPPAEGGFMAFVAANLVLNSRVGRDLEEACIDGLVTTWQRVRADILPGLFRLVMDFFKWLLEGVDRLLYAVDEWLRFRAGDSRLSLMAKAVLGPFWGAVTYVVRIVVNLLIEPQVNPIKHFPVVTVSHKLLLPLIPALGSVLAAQMDKELAYTAATLIIGAIPGIFGFLVWELKENWRLYRANRPAALEPVVIGHHGETMARLLRPGFHSGTLPKLYARLRRAERRALRTGQRKAPRKYRDALHELEGLVRHFVERDFLAILERSKTWGGRPIEVRGVALASNRVRVELGGPAPAAPGLVITIEEQSGWLLAGVAAPGWLGELSGERRQVLRAALAGLYKFAGVDLVREQIEACLGPGQVVYDVADEGLVVWAGPSGTVEAVYDLDAGPRMEPRIMSGPTAAALPALPAEPLRFDRVLVLWETWVDVWEQDQAGKEPPESLLEGVCLLPRTPPGR